MLIKSQLAVGWTKPILSKLECLGGFVLKGRVTAAEAQVQTQAGSEQQKSFQKRWGKAVGYNIVFSVPYAGHF